MIQRLQLQYTNALAECKRLALAKKNQTDESKKDVLEAKMVKAEKAYLDLRAELLAAIETKELETKTMTDTKKEETQRAIAAKLLTTKLAAVAKEEEKRAKREAEEAKKKLAADAKEAKGKSKSESLPREKKKKGAKEAKGKSTADALPGEKKKGKRGAKAREAEVREIVRIMNEKIFPSLPPMDEVTEIGPDSPVGVGEKCDQCRVIITAGHASCCQAGNKTPMIICATNVFPPPSSNLPPTPLQVKIPIHCSPSSWQPS